MIPKLGRGTSFAGLGAYLLHDKGAQTAERVSWTETRNLATNRAQAAISVMAATAMDQTRLKREAGVKATGRKSRESVLHVTLSWHPDEAEALTKDEMLRAADGAIKALGASDHQSLVVGHSDSDHPHVHLVINRVSPQDGRMLSSSKEKLKLSGWALEYEKGRGKVLCEERRLNAAARDRGHFTRGKKSKPRHIFELEAANKDIQGAAEVQAEQREQDRSLRRDDALIAGRQSKAWRELDLQHKAERAALRVDRKKAVERSKAAAVDGFRDAWRTLQETHDRESIDFESREASLLGKAANAWRSINWRGFLRAEDRPITIKESFGVIASKGARLAKLQAAQESAKRKLHAKEKAAEREAAAAVIQDFKKRALEMRSKRLLDRTHLEFTHQLERAALRSRWYERGEQRKRAWESLERRSERRSQDLVTEKHQEQTDKAVAHMSRMRLAMNEKAASETSSPKVTFRERARRAREQGKDQDQERDAGWGH